MFVRENLVRREVIPGNFRVAFLCCYPDAAMIRKTGSQDSADYRRRIMNTVRELAEQGYRHFITSGVPGFHMMAAESVVCLREEDDRIRLEMVSAWDSQGKTWSRWEQERREVLFREADMVTALGHAWNHRSSMLEYQYMKDNADLLVTTGDKERAARIWTEARQQGIMMIRIPMRFPVPPFPEPRDFRF